MGQAAVHHRHRPRVPFHRPSAQRGAWGIALRPDTVNVCDVPTPVSMTMSVLMVPTIIAHVQVTNNFIVCNYAADGGCLDNDDGSSYYSIRSNFCVYGKRVPLPPGVRLCEGAMDRRGFRLSRHSLLGQAGTSKTLTATTSTHLTMSMSIHRRTTQGCACPCALGAGHTMMRGRGCHIRRPRARGS